MKMETKHLLKMMVKNDMDLLNSYFSQKGLRQSPLESHESLNNNYGMIENDNDIPKLVDKYLEDIAGGFSPCNESIFEIWQKKREQYPELYELSMIIYSIPPTQTTVERLFSIFGFLYNDFRNQLSQDLLEDMILIITNEDLFHSINREDLITASIN